MNEQGETSGIQGATIAVDLDQLVPDLEFSERAGSGEKRGFDDRKAPGAFRTIGEVGRALGIRQHVLRYWEEQFPMLSPVKRSGNRRYYRPEDVELIETIDQLVHHQGYTLRGARLALEAKAALKPVSYSAPVQVSYARPSGPKSFAQPETAAWLTELLVIRSSLVAALEA